MISRSKASELASRHLLGRGDGFRYEPLSANPEGGDWIVLFQFFSREGFAVDGPMVVLVDRASGAVTVPSAG